MSNDDNGNGDVREYDALTRTIGDGPGLGVDELKRKPVDAFVFETSLSVAQCKAILRATRRHDVNFRAINMGPKTQGLIDVMRNDGWVWTDSDPLRLHVHPESGEIVCSDGQHRLFAAARSRRVLHTLVLFGDAWRAGVHVDRNRPRSVAQYLQHEHGIGSAPVYVAATRQHLSRVLAVQSGLSTSYVRNALPDEAVIDFVLKQHDVLQWAINNGTKAGAFGFSTTGCHVVLLELALGSRELAQGFIDDLLDNDLSPIDPLAMLRRSVGRRYNDTGIRGTVGFTIANLVKAHNLRSSGETVTKWLNVNTDDVVFPAGFRIDDQPTKGKP